MNSEDYGWETYVRRAEGHQQAVSVELSLNRPELRATHPWLIVFFLTLHQPTPDGLMSPQEAIKVQPLESTLVSVLQERYEALKAGILDAMGQVRYVFYAPRSEGLENAVADRMTRFPEYRYKAAARNDADWRFYRTLLYPDAEGWRQIREYRAAKGEIARHAQLSQEVVANLVRLGDDLSAPRKVDHAARFSSEQGRDLFLQAAVKLGYQIEGAAVDDRAPSELEYVVRFSKTQSVDFESVHLAERLLIRFALRFGGRYDGWGTFAIRPRA